MNISDILTAIDTGNYAAWKRATLKEKWAVLKEAEAAGRLKEIATPLGILSRWDCKVTIGAELNRRADPEKAANIRAWFS